ncbi:helitron helicase-like domain-containing protein [Artemisia annua]|uniref:Helitron helicase-like domain-containing protein n=1 Tax=Artemisia annua TaxID=35608 RepID=A0A2U1N2Y5_ARTAN|nr:helitron helicase-like domain-containing protein [Artemisia annua]
MRRPDSNTDVHAIGEPSTPHVTETTRSVHANGEPSIIQNVGHQSQRQKRNRRTSQPFRRSVRQRSLISNSQHDSDNCANNIDQGSSSYTTQGVSVAYDDLGDCTERCQYCDAAFWRGEHLIGHRFRNGVPQYHLCCGGDSNGPDLDPEVVQGLIHFLDTHNELVQIFRTARDKCAEHDVPEFKVRLYSGEGPRGYELPASQTLGAIVFDSGPDTESNYDVILEYRDGVVKRISKIHKSYMSL